jgi:hypothetical protein
MAGGSFVILAGGEKKLEIVKLWEPASRIRPAGTQLLQGCQIFLGTWYQNGKKCTKCIQNVPNGHKISPITIKYSKWQLNICINTFQSRALQCVPKLGFLVAKQTIWQPWTVTAIRGTIRVARWYICIPKITTWVHVGQHLNGIFWYFYGQLIYFMAIWYL